MKKKMDSKTLIYSVSLLSGLYKIQINGDYVDQHGHKVDKHSGTLMDESEAVFTKVSNVKIYEFPERIITIYDGDTAKAIAKYLMKAFDISLEEMEQELKEKGEGEWEGQ